jgi:hypothetical protein
MRCPECGYNLRAQPTGHCPECGSWFSTGAQILPLVKRLLHPSGPCRCVVCKRDLTALRAGRCPDCSSRYRAAS